MTMLLSGKRFNVRERDFMDYDTQKLSEAAELLKANEMNISEVAYALGFSSPNYFSTAFKNKFGISPKEYKSS